MYWPAGNPGPDFNGDNRDGDNLYSDSILALDVKTGKLKWYFQFTPHDIHDWDAEEPAVLVDSNWQGQPRKLLLQANRNGFFYVFDRTNGQLLLAKPFLKKLNWAEAIGKEPKELFLSRRLADDGLEAYGIAKRRNLEGLVAKDLKSPYEERRSRAWLKVKVHQEEEFVIAGYTAPQGSRQHIGALLLGAYAGDALHFVGKVGTGFSEQRLAELYRMLKPIERSTTPFVDPPREKGVTWTAPKLVTQIAFAEWTRDRKLRQPVFLGLRDDKDPRECLMPTGD